MILRDEEIYFAYFFLFHSVPMSSSPRGAQIDQTGSLLRMFRSEGFDAHMHIAYLFRMKDNQGVQDYLTNELYRMRERDIDFYLPELCLLGLSRASANMLHAFLLDKAASKMYYALKIHWLFQSAVEDTSHRPTPALLENAMKLYQESEMAVVNSRSISSRVIELRRSDSMSVPPSIPTSPTNSKLETSDYLSVVRSLARQVMVGAAGQSPALATFRMYNGMGDSVPSSTSHWRGGALAAAEAQELKNLHELDWFMLKQLRCDCFNQLNNFASQLTRLSSYIVSACTCAAERKRTLALAMAQLNQWLFDRRAAAALSGGETYMTGVWLPIPAPATQESTHVVKIHIEDCKVFRTRQRAPYLMVYEVVDFSDLPAGECLSDFVLRELEQEAPDISDFSCMTAGEFSSVDKLARVLGQIEPRILVDKFYPSDVLSASPELGDSTPPPGRQTAAIFPPVPSDNVIIVDDSNVTVVPADDIRKKVFGELSEDRNESIREKSVYGHLPSWRVQRVIVKGGDDVRQEVLAVQLVSLMKAMFQQARLPLWLRPYEVVVTSASSGLIEMIPNTVSIDSLKKEFGGVSMKEIFPQLFADHLEEAQLNFIESTAAYSVVSYLFQIRDRHNGNLLLDSEGHLMHIDFGFMLSNAPGGSFALETSPFKLTQEYIDVMGGEYSTHFETFRTLVIRAFLEARKHRDQICQLVKIVGECNPFLPCFGTAGVDTCVQALSDRFLVNVTEEACIERIVGLIDESINNWRTIQYDNYQRITNGIL
jgi:phosphatidylinositol 4-kinase B